MYTYLTSQRSFTSSSSTLQFPMHSGPKIALSDGGNSLVFPSQNMSGSFMLHIYTTSPIISLKFERSGEAKAVASVKKEFFAVDQYSSPHDILSVYKVGIPWLTDAMSGDYQVKVTNVDQESGTLNIKITKAEGKIVFNACC